MLAIVKFVAMSALLLGFAVGLGIGGVSALREGDTSTAIGTLLFAALFVLGWVGNLLELLEQRASRPAVAPAPPPPPPPARPRLPPGTPSNAGDTPEAFFVTTHGSATGYHFTDKLTPDGILAGFSHDEFTPGHVQTYGVRVPPALVERVFACVRSPAYAALPDRIMDPRICDGHVLRITSRVGGVERVIWLANTTDPVLTPLVEAIAAARPAQADAPWLAGGDASAGSC